MPSSRRRRFNVHNEIANRPKTKTQKETQINHQDPDLDKSHSQNDVKNIKSRNRLHPNTSKKPSMLEVLSECKTSTSTETKLDVISSDKEVTASSSNIDLFSLSRTDSLAVSNWKESIRDDNQRYKKSIENKDAHNNKTDIISLRDKYTHRIKVRSPKRKAPAVFENHICHTKTIAIDTVECGDEFIEKNEEEVEILKQVVEVTQSTEEGEERVSSHFVEDMCRICHSGEVSAHELGHLISACACRGTIGKVHVKCLERWLTESGKSSCELCGIKYVTKRVHKFGVFKALVMWILSNNSKHMIVDFFGIMIMTPIAVVAAGLTGRTFAGLMAQDQMTPWPLASTFVLACMTLVCYYCWIVSALTRHALGWWIWYRSHYEVRLQLQDDDDDEHSQSLINNDRNILYS